MMKHITVKCHALVQFVHYKGQKRFTSIFLKKKKCLQTIVPPITQYMLPKKVVPDHRQCLIWCMPMLSMTMVYYMLMLMYM